MFKSKIFFKVILAVLVLSIAFSAVGCSKSGDNTSSNNSNVSSKTEDTIDETPSSDTEDSESDDEEWLDSEYEDDSDDWVEEEFGDEFSEDDYLVENISISNGSKPVITNFLGMNGVYHCYTYMNDEKGKNYTEEDAQLEFNRLANTGVKIVRTYYNEEFAYNANTKSWDFESDNMKAVYRWMKELQKRGISIACNTGWGIKGSTDPTAWDPWVGSYVEGDLEKTAKNHADWMVKSLKQFRAHGINNVEYLIMFVEPSGVGFQYQDWINAGIEDMYLKDTWGMDPAVEAWLTCSRAIHDALVADGTRSLYKTVGPNDSGIVPSKDGNSRVTPYYYWAIKKASDYIDIYSSHIYPTISNLTNDTVSDVMEYQAMMQERIDMANAIGKEFWYDETNLRGGGSGANNIFNQQGDHPVEGMHCISYFADSMNRGVQNILWWSVFDQQWPNRNTTNDDGYIDGLHCNGYVPSLLESTIPETSYYAFSLLTKYFGNNATVYNAEAEFETFNVGVQQNSSGEWSICVSNFEVEDSYVSFNFEKNIGNQKFYRHVYDVNKVVPTAKLEILPADKIITTSGERFVDKIPANCAVVYTTVKD